MSRSAGPWRTSRARRRNPLLHAKVSLHVLSDFSFRLTKRGAPSCERARGGKGDVGDDDVGAPAWRATAAAMMRSGPPGDQNGLRPEPETSAVCTAVAEWVEVAATSRSIASMHQTLLMGRDKLLGERAGRSTPTPLVSATGAVVRKTVAAAAAHDVPFAAHDLPGKKVTTLAPTPAISPTNSDDHGTERRVRDQSRCASVRKIGLVEPGCSITLRLVPRPVPRHGHSSSARIAGVGANVVGLFSRQS